MIQEINQVQKITFRHTDGVVSDHHHQFLDLVIVLDLDMVIVIGLGTNATP